MGRWHILMVLFKFLTSKLIKNIINFNSIGYGPEHWTVYSKVAVPAADAAAAHVSCSCG